MTTLATPPRRSFLSDVFSVARTRAAVLVMNVASGVLVARLLGAEGKGLVAALTVAPAMILILCELGVVHSAAFHIGKKSASLDRVFGSLLMIGVVTTLFGVAICALYFKATWLPAYNWALVGLAIGTIPAAVFRSYASGVFLGTERIQLFNRASWIPPLTRLVLILALTGALGFGAYGAIGAQLAAGVAMALYAASLLRGLSSARPRFEWETTRAIASLGVSFAISLFLMTMLYKINIVLLQRMNTLEELGVYTVGANLAQYIWQIPAAMTAVVLSRGANAADADAYTKKVLVLFRLTIIVGVLGAGAIALAGPILIPLVYGESFAPSAQVLAAMLPGVTAFTVFKVLNLDLSARGRPGPAMAMAIPALALNFALGALWIPKFGAVGAGWASSVTYLAAALLYLALYCRALKLSPVAALRYSKADFEFLKSRLPAPIAKRMPL